MTDTRYYKTQYSSVLYLPKGTPRPCRDFMARTTLVVLRATSSVRRLHPESSPPSFSPSGSFATSEINRAAGKLAYTCADLAKQVKAFLSTDIGSSEEAQMAFQSIKKLLPDSCTCMAKGMLGELRSRLSRPPPPLPADYLAFTRKISSEIFVRGWDFQWGSKVSTFSPSLGSCIGMSRKKGGQLSLLGEAGQSAWQESLNQPLPGSLEGELLLVNSSGKPRALTRFASEASTLRPLHGLLYDTLSKQPWLLRGDVTAEKLKSAGFDPAQQGGKPLTSGDYKSATDNLPIEVAETILNVAWGNSERVPANVFRYALAAQRPRLTYRDDEELVSDFVPTRGQMMGSYLCFPLLCLQNYIAFRYAEMKSGVEGTPVLINGDDILFQAPRPFSAVWMDVVSKVGLEVEPTKTSISHEYGSINSTLLRWGPQGLRVIKTIRMGRLRECGHPGNLGQTALLFARCGPRETWLRNFEEFLSWHVKTIVRWRCTAQDMGFTGRLSLRAWSRYRSGRLLWRDDVLHRMKLDKLPAAHCPHNIVMGSEEFVTVPEACVSKQLRHDSAVWMASRKWELGREFAVSTGGKQVSERAEATRIPSFLQNWKTSAKELREAASRVMTQKQYYYHCAPERQITTGLVKTIRSGCKTTADLKAFEAKHCEVAVRDAQMARTWWRTKAVREGVRVPVSLWEVDNPPTRHEGMAKLPVTSYVPHTDVVRNLLTGEGEGIFLGGKTCAEMAGPPIFSFFRQFSQLSGW